MTIKTATNTETAALALAERSGWPAELRGLIERYPRDTWQGHENLGQMAQFWLSRHAMFRELGGSIAQGTARFQHGKTTAAEFAPWFAPRLQFFLEQLNTHHQIEDHHYFPIFRTADERLVRGFDVLEADHAALHHDIMRSVETANGLLRSVGDAEAAKREGEAYAQASGALLKGLMRHLDDEEDLIVPLILDRSEAGLGVAHG
jgi:iron-sulfur cluster repair protein YtfE (RIC family)